MELYFWKLWWVFLSEDIMVAKKDAKIAKQSLGKLKKNTEYYVVQTWSKNKLYKETGT
jgi:hypothetical protein